MRGICDEGVCFYEKEGESGNEVEVANNLSSEECGLVIRIGNRS